jgi:hypothetical protein
MNPHSIITGGQLEEGKLVEVLLRIRDGEWM